MNILSRFNLEGRRIRAQAWCLWSLLSCGQMVQLHLAKFKVPLWRPHWSRYLCKISRFWSVFAWRLFSCLVKIVIFFDMAINMSRVLYNTSDVSLCGGDAATACNPKWREASKFKYDALLISENYVVFAVIPVELHMLWFGDLLLLLGRASSLVVLGPCLCY